MNTIQVPLPRVLIMQTDKASREEVAGMLSRYGYSIVGPFAKWSEASGSIRSDAIEAAVVDWSGRDEEGLWRHAASSCSPSRSSSTRRPKVLRNGRRICARSRFC